MDLVPSDVIIRLGELTLIPFRSCEDLRYGTIPYCWPNFWGRGTCREEEPAESSDGSNWYENRFGGSCCDG